MLVVPIRMYVLVDVKNDLMARVWNKWVSSEVIFVSFKFLDEV